MVGKEKMEGKREGLTAGRVFIITSVISCLITIPLSVLIPYLAISKNSAGPTKAEVATETTESFTTSTLSSIESNIKAGCTSHDCSSAVDPHCGSDGLTYETECSRLEQGCLQDLDIAIIHKGSCEISTSLDGTTTSTTTTTITAVSTTVTETDTCSLENGIPNLIGDSFCDDINNVPECAYDGGDCCSDFTCQFCTECICELSGQWMCAGLCEVMGGVVEGIGDTICNDENNIEQCRYDDNDCCTDLKCDKCSDCICGMTGTSPCEPCYELKKLAKPPKVSSKIQEYNGCSSFGSLYAINNYIEEFTCEIFVSKYELYPWFQLEFDGWVTVHDVFVYQTSNGGFDGTGLFVGDVPEERWVPTSNQQCDYYSGPENSWDVDDVIVMVCDPPLTGKYVTLQKSYKDDLRIVEIDICGKYHEEYKEQWALTAGMPTTESVQTTTILPTNIYVDVCAEDHIYADHGVVHSPIAPDGLYPNSQFCHWKLTATQGSKIQIRVEHQAFEQYNDWVQVRDGHVMTSGDPIVSFEEDTVLETNLFNATSNKISIFFNTDSHKASTGFILSFSTGFHTELEDDNGDLMSPNYPEAYPMYSKYSWTLTVPSGFRVRLQFSVFDVGHPVQFIVK